MTARASTTTTSSQKPCRRTRSSQSPSNRACTCCTAPATMTSCTRYSAPAPAWPCPPAARHPLTLQPRAMKPPSPASCARMRPQGLAAGPPAAPDSLTPSLFGAGTSLTGWEQPFAQPAAHAPDLLARPLWHLLSVSSEVTPLASCLHTAAACKGGAAQLGANVQTQPACSAISCCTQLCKGLLE